MAMVTAGALLNQITSTGWHRETQGCWRSPRDEPARFWAESRNQLHLHAVVMGLILVSGEGLTLPASAVPPVTGTWGLGRPLSCQETPGLLPIWR